MEMAIVTPATSKNINGPTHGTWAVSLAEGSTLFLAVEGGSGFQTEVAIARPSSPSSSSYDDPQYFRNLVPTSLNTSLKIMEITNDP